ncbi:MAG: ATP-dependent DNA helicase, partial [Nitrospirae bacterium]|nr:ATP-dependent DNA helicase [Candidatus Manganitrophaceae bacterium]
NRGSTVFLHTSPLDVSAILREKLFRGDSPIILTSATLSTQGHFDFVKSRLGIDDAEEMKLETAFDYEKQALLYLPGHLPPPSSPRFTTAISDEIVRILQKSEGRAFLLFTSWRNLEAVYQNLSERLPYRLLKQGTQPKQVLIESFRKDISSVLFGTTSFWQGVDVAGEALSCVIIDKLPFASPGDPLTSARIDALGQQGKPAFVEYQIPLAMLSLRQGIGRLIRSRRDRGLIAILDHRITKKSYGKAFLDNLPNAPRTRTEDFKTVVSFFE